jgi:competence protein ComEC
MSQVAVAGEGYAAPRWRPRLVAGIVKALAGESDRRILWLPVFFGTGIALYFALTFEPVGWAGLGATGAAIALVSLLWRHPAGRDAAIAFAFAAAGFVAIQEAQRSQGAPILQRRLGPVAVTGRVVDIDALDHGWRIVVMPDPLPGLAASERPRHLRLHIPATSDPLRPGDRISLKAMLYPVPAQIMPGGRDMQRELYFAGIGAVGYSYGGARRLASAAEEPSAGGWREWVLRLRTEMTERIHAVLPGAAGGVASAVITGKRGCYRRPQFS